MATMSTDKYECNERLLLWFGLGLGFASLNPTYRTVGDRVLARRWALPIAVRRPSSCRSRQIPRFIAGKSRNRLFQISGMALIARFGVCNTIPTFFERVLCMPGSFVILSKPGFRFASEPAQVEVSCLDPTLPDFESENEILRENEAGARHRHIPKLEFENERNRQGIESSYVNRGRLTYHEHINW